MPNRTAAQATAARVLQTVAEAAQHAANATEANPTHAATADAVATAAAMGPLAAAAIDIVRAEAAGPDTAEADAQAASAAILRARKAMQDDPRAGSWGVLEGEPLYWLDAATDRATSKRWADAVEAVREAASSALAYVEEDAANATGDADDDAE